LKKKSSVYLVDCSEDDCDDEDRIIEIHEIFETEGSSDTKDLMIRVKWRHDGLEDEPFLLVKEDAPDAVKRFLEINIHLKHLVDKYTFRAPPAIAKQACTVIKTTNKRKSDVIVDDSTKALKSNAEKKQKTYHCDLNHVQFENLKEETRGTYFHQNNKYYGATCAQCNVEIKGASAMKPVYCCVHENHGCHKCVCSACIKVIIQSDSAVKRSRRTVTQR